jgi:uncharacterized protein
MATADDDVAERTCIVCREPKDEAELIRFVLSPDDRVVPDLRRRLPGRGVWVSLSRDAVAEACRRKLFARSLRARCTAEADLPEQVEKMLERDALALLSLANKAGLVVQGFGKVAEAIAGGRVRLLLAAADGAPDGRGKLAGRFKASSECSELAECFDSEQLGLALGRVNVIHAAVAAGPLAEKLAVAVRRLETYRGSWRTEVTKGV